MKLFGVANLMFAVFMFSTSSALAQTFADAPITRYYQISPGMTRGARPTIEGLQFLARAGVKTILNLEDDMKQVSWETEEAAKLGMKVISTPMSGFWRPKNHQVNVSLETMTNTNLYPLFVHCKHGEDRTGLITGLFRVFYQHRDAEASYHEMLDHGFHPTLMFLDQYYIDLTGYNPYQN